MTGTISTETLKRFIGGEAEIQNEKENYLFRGEISNISVEDNEVRIQFAWQAKNRGGAPPNTTQEWDIENPIDDYSASLEIYNPTDIGEERAAFSCWVTGELLVLFPHDGSKINPENIHGFPEELKTQQAEKFRLYDESR